MDNRTYPMTAEALERLKAELKQKEQVEKPALAARLKAAIEMGDLSENAEYSSAKEDQSFLEGRILELQEVIRGAVLITEVTGGETVTLGSRVTVSEEGIDDLETYLLVGMVEADPRVGKISNESPLGKALLGKKVGALVEFETPDGTIKFTIEKIQ